MAWDRIVRGYRITVSVVSLIVVESLVFGLAAVPAIGFWRWVGNARTWGPDLVRTAVLAVSVAPAYIIFSCALMGLTALACWAMRWRTPEGEHSLRDLDPNVLRWAKYSAATHVVRVICGELFRATPIWRWYLRAMGAKIGKGVHINTAAIYDINLFTLEDHVVIGGRAQLAAHLVEGGYVKAYPTVFRRGSTIGTGSIISPGVEVGEAGSIGALSFATKHTKVPAHTAYGGVPAKFLKEFEEKPLSDEELLYREPTQDE
ncbi:MAG: hypothetical protein R3185_07815 [Candidatus Thermoplasmatota archaeon]|nr:hypothetical protein [Candidatus Thermoplasmatota archaeon]